MPLRTCLTASAVALLLAAAPSRAADIILSMNDNHTVLDDQGNQVAPTPPRPDSVDLIDLGQNPPRIVGTVDVPGSVVGPPFAIWMAPDSSWAIVTAATKADPAGKFGISPDDRVSVLDLTSTPPHVSQTLQAGAGATTVRLSPDGTLALVCNRTEGTVSVFTVKDRHLEPAGKVDLGKQSGASGVAFAKDGKTAIVSRQFDHQVSVLHIDGTTVTVDKRPITTALAPYTMDITADMTLAAIANMGRGDGDADSVSLIDMTATPPRSVFSTSVASGPEPMKFSPDGRFLAVGAEMGTPLALTAPFYHDHGIVQVFAVNGQSLALLATAPDRPLDGGHRLVPRWPYPPRAERPRPHHQRVRLRRAHAHPQAGPDPDGRPSLVRRSLALGAASLRPDSRGGSGQGGRAARRSPIPHRPPLDVSEQLRHLQYQHLAPPFGGRERAHRAVGVEPERLVRRVRLKSDQRVPEVVAQPRFGEHHRVRHDAGGRERVHRLDAQHADRACPSPSRLRSADPGPSWRIPACRCG